MPYFDHNATTPLSPVAREAWLRASDEAWQNPSSPYRDAARTRIRLDQCREELAGLLGADANRIVFNSGATEGVNSVLAHWAASLRPELKVALNPTEHPCVVEAARRDFAPERLVWVEVDRSGLVRPDRLERLLALGGIGAVCVMAANNETGVVQPWREIGELCRRNRVPYLCDASQWLGKLPASGIGKVGWVTASAHKFGGPKGVGFLMLPDNAGGFRSQRGGEQEGGRRAGTENYPAIAAMIAALTQAETKKMLFEAERIRWRDAFLAQVSARLPGAGIVGAESERLWNTVSLVMPHSENHRWVARLDRRGFQVSTGSACATGKKGPSAVLAAMGFSGGEARRAIRISSGWDTTETDWSQLLAALSETEAELRESSTEIIRA